MARLSYAPRAQRDITEIAEYIARDKPDAARKWVVEVRRKCRVLARNPGLGDSRDEFGIGIRSAYLGHYIVFFRADGNMVEIVRVVRGDREMRFL
jgi:toxin ParE1/3/4